MDRVTVLSFPFLYDPIEDDRGGRENLAPVRHWSIDLLWCWCRSGGKSATRMEGNWMAGGWCKCGRHRCGSGHEISTDIKEE